MSEVGSRKLLSPGASQFPVVWYFDEKLFELEKKLIFDAGPGYVGHELMVPEVYDHRSQEWHDSSGRNLPKDAKIGHCPSKGFARMISRKYLYLIALAREKHFGRAAAACHVSPSTLSAAIRDLETELGVAVVERGKQFAGLTPEGRSVVEYAQRTAASAEGLKQELATLRDGLTGRLRLGVIPTALTVVAALTASFARRHPLVTAEVLSLATDEILTRLRRFELDAGIVYVESAQVPGLDIVPVWRERHVLLTGADGRFAGRESVRWAEAATVPLCLLTPDMQNRKTIDAVFAKVGAGSFCVPGKPLRGQVTAMLETNSIVSILAHVGSGHWSSIVPRSVLEQVGTPPGVVAIELVEPVVDWATGLVTLAREPQPPMVASLVAEAGALAESFEKSA